MTSQELDWDSVKAENIPVDKLQDNSYVQQLLQSAKLMNNLEEEVTLPYTITDITLISPGVWNDYKYTGQAIKNSYNRTDWSNSETKALFWDHADRASEKWIGEIKDVRLEGNRIVGDLEIVDKEAAIKLAYGAKFGISPKVTGDVHGQNMKSFVFDNFSVVLNPAVKTAYINNMEVKTVSDKDNSEELEEEAKEEEDVKETEEKEEETEENADTDKVKEQAAKLADVLDVKVEAVLKALDSLLKEDEEYPYPYTDKKSAKNFLNQLKELAEEEDEDEETEKEEVDNEETDEYAEFVKEMREKNPSADLKEIVEMWEEKQKSADEKISEATSDLGKQLENLEKKVDKKDEKIEELEEKVKEPLKASRRSDDEETKSLKEKVEELDDSELDKKMLDHMERLQGTKTRGELR